MNEELNGSSGDVLPVTSSTNTQIIDIVIEPARSGRKPIIGKFDVWDSEGNLIVTASAQPFFSAARALLERNVPRDALLRMFRAGEIEPDLTAPIIVAAGLRVMFERVDGESFAKWRGDSFRHATAKKRFDEKCATPIAKAQNERVLDEMI